MMRLGKRNALSASLMHWGSHLQLLTLGLPDYPIRRQRTTGGVVEGKDEGQGHGRNREGLSARATRIDSTW
jgi:hypothetical protein